MSRIFWKASQSGTSIPNKIEMTIQRVGKIQACSRRLKIIDIVERNMQRSKNPPQDRGQKEVAKTQIRPLAKMGHFRRTNVSKKR